MKHRGEREKMIEPVNRALPEKREREKEKQ